MLHKRQARIVESTARHLVEDDFQLVGSESARHALVRSSLLEASGSDTVQTDWEATLPSPEVSLEFIEQLAGLSPIMARLSLRLTIDDYYGCWALNLYTERDDKGRARYPTLYDKERGKQGVLAHRYVWRTLIDPDIPSRLHLDHLCRVHACCNPGHLDAVTLATNPKRGNHARHLIGGQGVLFSLEGPQQV